MLVSATSQHSSFVYHPLLQARERCGDHVDRPVGTLLYHIATRFRGSKERAAMLAEYVCGGKVTAEVQLTGEEGRGGERRGVVNGRVCCVHTYILPCLPPLPTAALEYLLSNPVDPVDRAQFEESCGVGVVITEEQIKECVSEGDGEGVFVGQYVV